MKRLFKISAEDIDARRKALHALVERTKLSQLQDTQRAALTARGGIQVVQDGISTVQAGISSVRPVLDSIHAGVFSIQQEIRKIV